MGDFEGKKILVVDDSATMRMLLAMTLRKAMKGVSVTEAKDGLDGIEKFQGQAFDIVITDIQMPGMDGVQFVDTVRRSFNNDVPILVVSTKGYQHDIEAALSAGANGYITKPVNGSLLKQTVAGFLTKCEV